MRLTPGPPGILSYIKINYESVNIDPLKIRRDHFGIYQISCSDSRQIFSSDLLGPDGWEREQ